MLRVVLCTLFFRVQLTCVLYFGAGQELKILIDINLAIKIISMINRY